MNAGCELRLLALGPNYHVHVGNGQCSLVILRRKWSISTQFRSDKEFEVAALRSRLVYYLCRLLDVEIAAEHELAAGGS